MSNVAKLENEQSDPVDVGNEVVQGEGGRVEVVLVPNSLLDVVALVAMLGRVENVIDGDDNGQDPGE